MKLWQKILIALFLGTLTGFFIHQEWLPSIISDILAPIGTIFLNLISMNAIFHSIPMRVRCFPSMWQPSLGPHRLVQA